MTVSSRVGTALRLTQLRAGFDGKPVVEIGELDIAPGELVAIAGPSGCGKSTLLRLIAGLLPPDGGHVEFSSPNQGRSPRIGFVFQDATLLPWRTSADNIRLPGELERNPISPHRVEELATFVGLAQSDLRKRPVALSGGMKMRVSLARALALKPDVLLLDEPFAALDELLRQQLQADVIRMHRELNLTTILVTHNVTEAVFMSDRVITLGGTPARVTGCIETRFVPEHNNRMSTAFAQANQEVTRLLSGNSPESAS